MGFKLNKDDVDKLNSLSRVEKHIKFTKGTGVAVMNTKQTNYATCELSNEISEEFFLMDIGVLLKNLNVYEKYESEYELSYDDNTKKLRISASGSDNKGKVKTYIDTANPVDLGFHVPLVGLKLPESDTDIVFTLSGENIETALKLKGVNKTDIIAIVKRDGNTHITIEGFLRSVIDGNKGRNTGLEKDKFIDPVWSIELEEYDGQSFVYYFPDAFFRLHKGDYDARIIQFRGEPEKLGRSSTGDSDQLTSMGLISKNDDTAGNSAVNYIIGYYMNSRNQEDLR